MKNAPGHDIDSNGTGWQLLHRLQRFLADDRPRNPEDAQAINWRRDGSATDREGRPATHTPSAAGRQVLVVDDNPVNLMIASEMLSSFNVSALVAADGAEAVALAGDLQLDLILMDLQMPVLDGLSALRQIRAAELARKSARVNVVAYTSSSPAWAVMEVCGFDGVLGKPCDHADLRDCLARWAPQLLQEADVARAQPLQPWPHHAPRQAVATGITGPGALPG